MSRIKDKEVRADLEMGDKWLCEASGKHFHSMRMSFKYWARTSMMREYKLVAVKESLLEAPPFNDELNNEFDNELNDSIPF